MSPRDPNPHDDELIDVSELEGIPSLESFLFSPPSLAPSREDLERVEDEQREMDADEAPRRLGFGMRRTLAERLAHRTAASEPAGAPGGPQDPFATLLTPLSGPELARLRAEVEADTVVYDRFKRTERQELRAQRIGLIGALVLALCMAGFWFGYLKGLADLAPPQLLAEHLSEDHAQIAVYGLGVLVPLLGLGLVARAIAELAGAVLTRSPVRVVPAIAVSAFAAITLKMMDAGLLGAGLVAAVAGYVLVGVLSFIVRPRELGGWRRRKGHGSPRR